MTLLAFLAFLNFFSILKHLRERSHNTYALRGGGGKRFVTKPCRKIGICTVLRYEGGGGGGKNHENGRYLLCERSLMAFFSIFKHSEAFMIFLSIFDIFEIFSIS